ncbi:hypothetical protein [Pseudomonas sp. GD03944]|uniref:hypothetical protein n=1 Tax=Pseudomonas sp. GD03944 TaxID=2975409 RepID=UPI002448BF71|nr:hypothetical protein [Pseudomonas sp. GD03944]MDH1264903.1 hypothetical protein [Pseudomonas sp. GD03944]
MASDLQLQLVATLLRRGKAIDRLSSAVLLLALAIGLSPLLGVATSLLAAGLCTALVVLGGVQKFYAIRVAIDAELFQHLSQAPDQLERRTAELDQALLGLGQPAANAGRSWAQRSQGALGLLRRQALWCGLQLLVAVSAVLLMPWLSNG